MAKYDKADLERRMRGAVEAFKQDLSGLRTGRANIGLLDPVTVTRAWGRLTSTLIPPPARRLPFTGTPRAPASGRTLCVRGW